MSSATFRLMPVIMSLIGIARGPVAPCGPRRAQRPAALGGA